MSSLDDVTGITSALKGASDAEVCSIIVSVCSNRPRLQMKLIQTLSEPLPERCVGVIKSFFPDKQFGFIACPELYELYGRDVFLSSVQLGVFGIGSNVSFLVTLGKDGQPQAQDLQEAEPQGKGIRVAVQPHAGKGCHSKGGMQHIASGKGAIVHSAVETGKSNPSKACGKGVKRVFEGDIVQAPRVKIRQTDPTLNRFVGVIKSFFEDKNFGFIDCAETFAQFGRDVFLSNMQIGPFSVGSTVSFTVTCNTQGHPQAQELEDAMHMGSSEPMERSNASESRNIRNVPEPESRGKGLQFPDIVGMLTGSSADDATRHIGTIKKFDRAKKYGFIECPELKAEFGSDVFLSDKQIGPFDNGNEVSFLFEVKSGKPQALDLQPIS